MAAPKKATEEVQNGNGVSNDNTEKDSLKQENNQLRSELDEMKAMMKQLMDAQIAQNTFNATKEIVSDPNELDDEYIEIPQNKQINVTSLFYGGMTLYGTNDKKIRFDKFGITRPVSYGDLIDICNRHRGLAEEGAFFIHNKDAIEALYLANYYHNILDPKKIENLLALPHEEIDKIMASMTDIQKNTVENIVIDGIMRGDNKYTNFTKVDIVNKHCKRNLQKIAQERMQQK